MNLWHASTELHTTAAVAAKALYPAAALDAGCVLGLSPELDPAAHLEVEAALSGKSDPSG